MSTSFSRRQSFRFALASALTFTLAAGTWPRPQRAADSAAGAPAEVPTQANVEIEQRAREAYGKLGVSFEENRGQVDGRLRFISRRGGASVFLTNDAASFVLSPPQAPATASDERRLREERSPDVLARRDQLPERRERPKSHTVRMKFEGANPAAEVSGERELEGKVNYFRGKDPSKWLTNVKTYGAVRYRGLFDGVDLVYYGNESGQTEYDFEVAPGADPGRITLLIEGAKALEVDAAGDLVISTPAGEMRQRKPVVYQEVGGARRAVEGGYVIEAGGRVRFALGEYDKSAPLVIDPVLEYSTYLGGNGTDSGFDIEVDAAGNAYVSGITESPDFPTANALKTTLSGRYDAFVLKLNADGSALVYCTFFGGSGDEAAWGIAVDSAGDAYVTGYTSSTDFPLVNAVQNAHAGGFSDAFVAKLNTAGSALVYSTYLGGSGGEIAQGVAVDPAGNACVTGFTESTDLPVVNATQGALDGSRDAFVAKLNTAGSALVYSTYLGGSGLDVSQGIAVDSAGNACVAGYTDSTDFPVVNAVQTTPGGMYDAFVTKLNADGSALAYSTYLGGSKDEQAFGIAVDPAGAAYVTGGTISTDFPVVNAFQGSLNNYDDAFVTKLNAAGSALVYSTYLGGFEGDGGRAIAVDPSGSAYVTGFTAGFNFPIVDPIQKSTYAQAGAFVTKLNAAGSALVYSSFLGGSGPNGAAVDSSGDLYVTGYAGSTNFPLVNPIQDTYGGSFSDAFVTKISFLRIRGRVVTRGATGVVGVPWVTVKLTGSLTKTELTDAQGYYSITGLRRGDDYTVTPTKTNLSFAPAGRTFNNLYGFLPDVNFTAPSLSVGNVAVTEGSAGDVTAAFTVRLSPASGETVTVNYETIGGATNSAAVGADYTALPLTQLTFAPGETEKDVAVTVKADALDEADETFRLRLTGAVNALALDNKGVCTIRDNDSSPSLSINDVAVTEGGADVTATFTVTLSAASGRTVKVNYETANGTATAPADYTAVGVKTLTFSPGETSKTVSVTVRGDALDEALETFKVRLTFPTNAALADGIGVCAITDDD